MSDVLVIVGDRVEWNTTDNFDGNCPPNGVLVFKELYENNKFYYDATQKRLLTKYQAAKNREDKRELGYKKESNK